MAWLLFIDESGQDHKESPYEVLAGVAIKDENLWPFICALQEAERSRFGRRYSDGTRELKGKSILKRKTFAHAALAVDILPNEVPPYAKEILDDGGRACTPKHMKALAQAKIAYVSDVFSLCEYYNCRFFASIVEIDAPPTRGTGLRKDYGYLFERFFYFLEDISVAGRPPERGVLVFDELEKSRSHIFIDQASQYFIGTATGRQRASLIIPEPFFVHSELTTGVQVVDLAAYCISWAFRGIRDMKKPARAELAPYIEQISKLRHKSVRNIMDIPDFQIWSFSYIDDLRTLSEIA